MSLEPESVQANITSFWNLVAPHYEDDPGNTVPFGSEAHQRWLRLFARTLPLPPADVLDLGTGTGFSALLSAALGHNVIGIDLAVGMLEVARKMAAERGLPAHFDEGDAVAPEFEEAIFDVITCRYLLWTLRDAKIALSNWKRLLRPGGRVVAFDSFRPWPQPTVEVDPDDLFGRHYTPVVQTAIPFLNVQNEAVLVEAFKQAGFTEVRAENLPAHYAGGEEEDLRPYVVVALTPSHN